MRHTPTMDYQTALERNGILTAATVWMGLEDVTLSDRSQTQKDTYRMISTILPTGKDKKKDIVGKKKTKINSC